MGRRANLFQPEFSNILHIQWRGLDFIETAPFLSSSYSLFYCLLLIFQGPIFISMPGLFLRGTTISKKSLPVYVSLPSGVDLRLVMLPFCQSQRRRTGSLGARKFCICLKYGNGHLEEKILENEEK